MKNRITERQIPMDLVKKELGFEPKTKLYFGLKKTPVIVK